jgi:hypothetical protein
VNPPYTNGGKRGQIRFRHCERSEAIQSSVPHDGNMILWLGGAISNRAAGGTEDWIASSLRSSQ